MSVRIASFFGASLFFLAGIGNAQTPPNVSQVLLYSGTTTTGSPNSSPAFPSIFSYVGPATTVAAAGSLPSNPLFNTSYYTVNTSFGSLLGALNGSIATALSVVPLASPASGYIVRKDPQTGLELDESSTLGPIFTERAETIGKGKFYVGFSNQDFHFTKYNGTSLNALSVLYQGNQPSTILNASGTAFSTQPAVVRIGMDVRLSQDITFLTYGLTDRFDVSVGLPIVHSAVSARTYGAVVYAGNGAGATGACWCVDTFANASEVLAVPQIGAAALGKTGFGDFLVRGKGTVLRTRHAVLGVGADVRFPTGDVHNYLGVGTTTVKPFAAVSFFSKPFRNGIVLSPHLDGGWQFSGKSILAGQLQGTSSAGVIGAPFSFSKAYLPSVFSWAGGTEIALGNRNTLVVDFLGNEIGWSHGIQNTKTAIITNCNYPASALFPSNSSGQCLAPTIATGSGTIDGTPVAQVSGLIPTARTSYGQYNGSFGYKARVAGNLIVYFDALIRLDNNGLAARFTPLFGLGYSFSR